MKVSARASFLKFLPRSAAFVLLIIALLEPSFGNIDGESKIKASNKIIYFVVDVSKSMDAKDVAAMKRQPAFGCLLSCSGGMCSTAEVSTRPI